MKNQFSKHEIKYKINTPMSTPYKFVNHLKLELDKQKGQSYHYQFLHQEINRNIELHCSLHSKNATHLTVPIYIIDNGLIGKVKEIVSLNWNSMSNEVTCYVC
ncbi:uncharacterized protein KGF55_002030 [Candida pseudojiufengensis]|uniref:uncharacterized protein n=1 Tax=Candida pseudojiufengensis TaxID=497109 RepID=UPI002223F416|nr:uncharacterized protein KGF55_002030 [Candida pseudojiufengensis]KAI5964088.1 hypothetical protein KGF55_002030 [Candida pseudojiufengensis]